MYRTIQMKPTKDFYDLFQFIYDFFNHNLFRNELPNCMIVITRKKGVFGYYAKDRWVNSENIKTDELAINPLFFNKYPIIEIFKTMGHEMCHLWQHHFGTPSRRTYHNKEWGNKMISIGLMPSNTGKEGGSMTGQQMMEYVIENSIFLNVCSELIKEDYFKNFWIDLSPSDILENNSDLQDPLYGILNYGSGSMPGTGKDTQGKRKIKYVCNCCKIKVWGKEGLSLTCNDCDELLEQV